MTLNKVYLIIKKRKKLKFTGFIDLINIKLSSNLGKDLIFRSVPYPY